MIGSFLCRSGTGNQSKINQFFQTLVLIKFLNLFYLMVQKPDTSTEQKILDAARTLFLKKGYANTRTRDIALEAGINLALLNYYYRSKEKLFEIIMMENLQSFLAQIRGFLQSDIPLEAKVDRFASEYIDLLLRQPELPLFILSELRNHPEHFIRKTGLGDLIKNLGIYQEVQALKGKEPLKFHPINLFMNLASMTIFPFMARPIVQALSGTDESEFRAMMEARKKLIPAWFRLMLKTI